MFGDAVENYQYLTVSPVLRKLRPVIAIKEARHLNLHQVKELLKYTEDKECGLAIWVQIYLGLRLGELIALRWEDVDISPSLTSGRIHIRRTYVSKTGYFRDYPKGGKQHSHSIPAELLQKLVGAKAMATTPFVVCSPRAEQLPYKWYMRHLKNYCSELKIPVIATHGLRHSTSELYIHHGATRDDLRRLFAHSTPAVTDRYVHDRGTNLEKIANVIRLFPTGTEHESNTAG
jgi:integrase